MTVSELIAQLQTLPPSALVLVDSGDYGQDPPTFVGELYSCRAGEVHDYCGQFIVDDDPARLLERVGMCPEFPDQPEIFKAVYVGFNYE